MPLKQMCRFRLPLRGQRDKLIAPNQKFRRVFAVLIRFRELTFIRHCIAYCSLPPAYSSIFSLLPSRRHAYLQKTIDSATASTESPAHSSRAVIRSQSQIYIRTCGKNILFAVIAPHKNTYSTTFKPTSSAYRTFPGESRHDLSDLRSETVIDHPKTQFTSG